MDSRSSDETPRGGEGEMFDSPDTSSNETSGGERAFALTVAYDGSRYAGWQSQINAISVQQRVEEAIAKVVHHSVRVTGSGRTDAGVHAVGQVAKFSTSVWRHSSSKLLTAINQKLPRDIVVRGCREARLDFDPVRQAIQKRYRYTIRSSFCHDPFGRRYHWLFQRPLDFDGMQEAGKRFVGTHDFVAFQSLGSPRKTTVRTIHDLSISRIEALDGFDITIEVEADGFLYNMVRNIVGALIEIGTQKWGIGWIDDLLQSKSRGRGWQTAPPQGLCLLRVDHPEVCFLEKSV